jgi:hypothetical protein
LTMVWYWDWRSLRCCGSTPLAPDRQSRTPRAPPPGRLRG